MKIESKPRQMISNASAMISNLPYQNKLDVLVFEFSFVVKPNFFVPKLKLDV